MAIPAWQQHSAVPGQEAATLLAVLQQFDQTQWWTPDQLRKAQFRQLGLLLDHAHATVPFYRERLDKSRYRPGMDIADEWFCALPRISRAEVHALDGALFSTQVPPEHAPVMQGQTSGSTGTPVTFRSTALTQLFWQAFNLRDHAWHRRDLELKLATIRPDRGVRDDRGVALPNWAPAIAEIFRNGPSGLLHSGNTLDRQLEWLLEQDPDYLLTLASNLLELVREMRSRGIRLPRLREARTFGDALQAGARAECESLLGVKVVDMYSAQETGYLALQCPDHDCYHVQSEGAIVELLNEDGHACSAGQMGRVVVTTLHNFAMPLVRYEVGDYAEAGAPCACGRGLPVIRRILGRERNLAVTPDGKKFYPSFAAEVWAQIAPIRQIQLVQKSRVLIEVRMAMARDLQGDEARELISALRRSLGYPYEFAFVRMDSIPRSASGKYEDFVSEARA